MGRGIGVYYPSQIRYQERNPLIAFRVKRQDYDNFKEEAEREGVSLASLVRARVMEGRGDAKEDKKVLEEAREEAFEEGYNVAKEEEERRQKEQYDKGYKEGKKEAKKEEERARKEGLKKGYKEGYEEAVKEFKPELKKRFLKGYERGFKDGREEFEITYPCRKCEGAVRIIPNSEDHEVMKELMRDYGRGHEDCEGEYEGY